MTYAFHADLGGQPGHGPVTPEPEGEFWHEAFEPKALALTLAMGATGAWNIDQSRSARETLPDYARLSYYRIWLAALQRLLAERGLLGDDEVAAGRMLHPPLPLPRKLLADAVPAALAKGSPTERPPMPTPRAWASSRSGCTPWCSTAARCGARMPSRGCRCRWTPGTATCSLTTEPPHDGRPASLPRPAGGRR